MSATVLYMSMSLVRTAMSVHLIPVLLGQGRRLLDNLAPEHIDLERTRIREGHAGVIHMHYRVQR